MSSIRNKRARGCVGKLGYARQSDAAAKRDAEAERGGDWLGIYLCRHCGQYHLGHKLRPVGRLHRRDAKWILLERDWRVQTGLREKPRKRSFNPIRRADG